MYKNTLSAKQKALKINLDSRIYGTFAEIGAGQEVARYFFQAGAASGTIAKTMSAYDMKFSDEIYGKEKHGRYVSQSRLERMIDREYRLVLERLTELRGNSSLFFAFADTVATTKFGSGQEGHGWLGIKFQLTSGGPAHEIKVHIRLHDSLNLAQQNALGVIGVNLVYGAFYLYDQPIALIDSLFDNIDQNRVEIDFIAMEGPEFKRFDNRLLNLHLVQKGYTNAVLFDKDRTVLLPADEFYKKDILVVRGSYRPPTLVNVDTIEKGLQSFSQDLGVDPEEVYTICEITMNQLNVDQEPLANTDFLARMDLLALMNKKVMVSNYPQYYRLTSYFCKYKCGHLAIVLGAYNFQQIFDDKYSNQEGGLLESLGQLLRDNVRLYLYPYHGKNGETLNLNNLEVPKKYLPIYEYVKNTGYVRDIENANKNILHIFSRKVLELICSGQTGWEEMVPAEICDYIKKNQLFCEV